MSIDEDSPFSDSQEQEFIPPAASGAKLPAPVEPQGAPEAEPEEAPPVSPYPQDQREVIPEPLSFCFLANIPDLRPLAQQIAQTVNQADLIISLGGIDLQQLAAIIPGDKPTIAVLGPRDSAEVPGQFTVLQASGVSFQDWKLAGISGGPGPGPSSGLYLEPEASLAMLNALAPCDFFFSHAPPQALYHQLPGALPAIDEYIASKYPWAVFYAHPEKTIVEPYQGRWDTLALGVHGIYFLPEHKYPGSQRAG